MKKFIVITFLLVISSNAWSVSNVSCSDSGCLVNGGAASSVTKPCIRGSSSPDSTKTEFICDSIDTTYDVITATSQYNDNISISSSAVKNRNLLLYTKSGNDPGKSLVINMPATNKDTKASNFLIVGDTFNSVNININGYSGKKGKDASEICADNILSDKYGAAIKTFYNQRRLDTSVSRKCDDIDYQYMKDRSFSCESGFDDVTLNDRDSNSQNPIVNVTQIQQRARCSSIAYYHLCMKRKVRLQCGYKLFSTLQTKFLTAADVRSPVNLNVNVVKYAPEMIFWENEYNKLKVQYGNDQEICNTYHPLSSLRNSVGASPTNLAEFYGGVSGYSQSTVGGVEQNGIPSEYYSVTTSAWTSATSGNSGLANCPDPLTPAGVTNYALNYNWNQSYNNYYNSTLSQYSPSSIILGSATGEQCKDLTGTTTDSWGFPVNSYAYYSRTSTPRYVKAAIWKTFETKSAAELGSNFYVQPAVQPSGKRYTLTGTPTLDSSDIALVEDQKFSDGSNISDRVFEYQKQPFFRSCNESENFVNVKQVYLNLTQFSVKTNVTCSGIADSRDVDSRLIWTYAGLTQDPSFDTETLNCSIGSCPVNISVSDVDYSLDNIIPESGESATEQGKGIIFAYDILNMTSQYSVGVAGHKGLNDIIYPRSEKICAKVDDYNQGPNSEQARHPLVTFKRYSWTPITSSAGGNEGIPARNTGKKIEVFKKLDPAVRYFLKARLL